MAESTQDNSPEAAQKKIDVPDTVRLGQALGYDPNSYTTKTKTHGDLLKRFGVATYASFEEKLGTQFARAVVAFLLGDAEHARVFGTTLISEAQPPVPGGVKADLDGDADSTYKKGKQEVSVKDGVYFINGYKFVEKRHADLYASSLDAPAETSEPNEGFASSGVFEKTAEGADGEIGSADHYKQAQKDKDDSGVSAEVEKTADAATI